jgi:SAM-dependent methyltransferase
MSTPEPLSGEVTEAMIDEFDATAMWTAEAVLDLGPEYALPAACRGSGTPASLDWLIQELRLAPNVGFLDSGAGVGGPAEYAARSTGALPILVEPMEGACRAASRLFGRPVVVGNGTSLPCPDKSFSAALSLGVLCTVPDKTAHLNELARVLGPHGKLGLLVYERSVPDLPQQPRGNHFPSVSETNTLVRQAGLVVAATALLTEFGPAPTEWQATADRVDAWIAERHESEATWQKANEQQSIVRSLIESELVVGRLIVAQRSTYQPRLADAVSPQTLIATRDHGATCGCSQSVPRPTPEGEAPSSSALKSQPVSPGEEEHACTQEPRRQHR